MGAGHAGLATSHVLGGLGVEHVVLERDRVAERWLSERWESLRLLTPNWATRLPGWTYDGPEPDGFMRSDEVAAYLQAYAESFAAPVRTGVEVTSMEVADGSDRYLLRTRAGALEARSVVIATGAFQGARIPPAARALPPDVLQLHSSAYRSPDALPAGAVLVVGTGASGQQIAEELLAAGRRVHLSVGRHRRVPRRYRGRDYFWWLENTGFYEKTADQVPVQERRGGASPALTGAHGGGHDLDLRRLAAEGATLVGRIRDVSGAEIELTTDLAESLARGDQAYDQFVQWVEQRLELPGEEVGPPEPRPAHPDPPEVSKPLRSLNLRAAGLTSVVWATGFRPQFDEWVRVPVLDDTGHPVHHRGVTSAPGIFFVGLHWLHRLRSGFIRGADEDARYVCRRVAERAGAAGRSA